MLCLVGNPIVEVCHTGVQIVGFKCWVVNYRLIIVHSIEVERTGSAVVLVEGVGEDLCAQARVVEEGTLDPFALALSQSAQLIFVINTSKEPSVKAHL